MKKLFYFIILFLLASPFAFSQNLTVVENALGIKGYVNNQNKIVIPYKYAEAHEFINNLAIVKFKNKFGVINYKDEIIIPFEYNVIKRINNNTFKVTKDNDVFYFNKKGKKIKYKN